MDNANLLLGFTGKITELVDSSDFEGFQIARVVVEHRERYIIQIGMQQYSAEITGNLRYSASSSEAFPAVGDWVKIMTIDDDHAIILQVLPRVNRLARKAIGKSTNIQLIATNLDFGCIVQSPGHDFNMNRLDRYLAICHGAEIIPIFILSKIDLIEAAEVERLTYAVQSRAPAIEICTLSNHTGVGLDKLASQMQPYKSYCFLGSSGVGKSTIINHLLGQSVMETSTISEHTQKGRHTTSHRSLFILPNQSIVIDTPGMRELGLTDQEGGVDVVYSELEDLATNCQFNDCSHTNEKGCAVLDAIERGDLTADIYNNYMKLQREQVHFTSSIQEKRRRSKEQGKLYKAIQQAKRKSKFNN